VRLFANLVTDEDLAADALFENNEKTREFVELMTDAIARRKAESKTEEFLLNAISCLTNILFYDVPQGEAGGLLADETRVRIFKGVGGFIYAS